LPFTLVPYYEGFLRFSLCIPWLPSACSILCRGVAVFHRKPAKPVSTYIGGADQTVFKHANVLFIHQTYGVIIRSNPLDETIQTNDHTIGLMKKWISYSKNTFFILSSILT